jgi:hypothetical protein
VTGGLSRWLRCDREIVSDQKDQQRHHGADLGPEAENTCPVSGTPSRAAGGISRDDDSNGPTAIPATISVPTTGSEGRFSPFANELIKM